MTNAGKEQMTAHRGLPVSQLTEFIGREAELRDLRDYISRRRLVTITGEAGVGKSRTAARVADTTRRSFGASAARVEVDSIDRLPDDIAVAVGAGGAAVEDIARHLGERPFLLILDGLDRPESAATFIEQLLSLTIETRILATSRRRIGIRGETPYVLPPLDLPTPGWLHNAPESALTTASSALLVSRIIESDPSFRVAPAMADDLFIICRAADGLPRYIEAAARAVAMLGVHEAAFAVAEDPTVLLAFLPRGVEASLRSEIASTATLSPEAATLLRRLSLLESGFDLRFAAELFTAGSLADIASPVAELVTQSVVRSESVGGERRIRVPLHLRTRILQSWTGRDRVDDENLVRLALLARLRECAIDWFSDEQPAAIQFLNCHAADITSLLSVMSVDPTNAHTALDVISSLRYYWQLHPVDPWPRVRDWLCSALQLDPARDETTLRAMQTDAYIAYHEGDLEGARAQLEAIDKKLKAIDKKLEAIDKKLEPGTARYGYELFNFFVAALLDVSEERFEDAEPKLRTVLRASLEADVQDHLGEKYWHLAACQLASGKESDAMETVAEGLKYCDRVGDVWGRSYMWCLVALIHSRRGDAAAAVAQLGEAVAIMTSFGDRVGLALCMQLLSSFTLPTRGEADRVAELVEMASHAAPARPPVPLPELRPETRWLLPPPPLPDSKQLGDVLGRIIGGAPARPADTSRVGSSSVLSAREAEIAGLIAEGLGNPAIAARLVLSRRTVEGHVQRILAKLGFRSRSQVAVWAAQHGAKSPVAV